MFEGNHRNNKTKAGFLLLLRKSCQHDYSQTLSSYKVLCSLQENVVTLVIFEDMIFLTLKTSSAVTEDMKQLFSQGVMSSAHDK